MLISLSNLHWWLPNAYCYDRPLLQTPGPCIELPALWIHSLFHKHLNSTSTKLNSWSASLKPDPLPAFLISGSDTAQFPKAKNQGIICHFPVSHHHPLANNHQSYWFCLLNISHNNWHATCTDTTLITHATNTFCLEKGSRYLTGLNEYLPVPFQSLIYVQDWVVVFFFPH